MPPNEWWAELIESIDSLKRSEIITCVGGPRDGLGLVELAGTRSIVARDGSGEYRRTDRVIDGSAVFEWRAKGE